MQKTVKFWKKMQKITKKSENLKKTTKCGGAGAARPSITTTHVLSILNPFMPEKAKNYIKILSKIAAKTAPAWQSQN